MKEDQIDLIFTGDLCCHNRFAQKLESGEEIISDRLKNLLKEADSVIFNYEGSSFGVKPAVSGKTNLKNSLEIAPYLSSFSKPVFNLANNHTMDYGKEGLIQTIEEFQKKEWQNFGAGESSKAASTPFMIQKGDLKINIWGIHAYSSDVSGHSNFGLNGLKSMKYIKKAIKIQRDNQKNIICIHGGEEFTFYPMPEKRRLLQKIAMGIRPDVILCHHSHTIQGVEIVNGTLVFYSLGNFMFDFPSHAIYDDTQHGLLVKLHIRKDKISFQLSGINCDLSGIIIDTYDLNTIPEIENRLDISDYKQNIGPDAHRVIFESKKNRNKILPQVASDRKKYIFSINRLRLLLSILSDRFLISLYYQALKYKFFVRAFRK